VANWAANLGSTATKNPKDASQNFWRFYTQNRFVSLRMSTFGAIDLYVLRLMTSNVSKLNFCITIHCLINTYAKPGGLDIRDRLRSRSRFLDLLRSTFETCQDCPYCWDKIFLSWSRFLKGEQQYCQKNICCTICRNLIFSTVETYFFPVSRSKLSIETTSRQIETPRLNLCSNEAKVQNVL
jgi:hypothetical protein